MIGAIALVVSLAAPQDRVRSQTGDIRTHLALKSAYLKSPHDVLVYLPPGSEKGSMRYPVFYVGDGQNVFDGMTSYIPNKEWRMDEAAQALIEANLIEPLIIVAVSNAGMERANEYLPTRAKYRDMEFGGQGDLFVKMLAGEIKPLIDRTYRTKKGPTDTAIGGSSFGGIMALHTALSRPDVFGKAAVVSPSLWWDDRSMVKRVDTLKGKLKLRLWLDMGTEEGADAVPDLLSLGETLKGKGWQAGKDMAIFIDKGAQHNEDAWARRAPLMLMFLFGKG